MKDDDDTLCYRYELEAAVKAEREACAKLCDEFESDVDPEAGAVLAAAIRARGKA